MSFFEDIAAALDAEGIESRVDDDVLFVPITSDLEIQFLEIDPHLPAANVYIAAADVDEDDEDFEAVLVSVVFSAADAVATVNRHVATDQVVTVLRDLLEATDERIEDLDFYQDPVDPNLVTAEVGEAAELKVFVEVADGTPTARVYFATAGDSFEDLVDQAIDELWESDADATLSDEDRRRLFAGLRPDPLADLGPEEVLSLGSFTDFDKLFDVLSLAADQAESWEEQLTVFDDDFDDDFDDYDPDADYDDEDELEADDADDFDDDDAEDDDDAYADDDVEDDDADDFDDDLDDEPHPHTRDER